MIETVVRRRLWCDVGDCRRSLWPAVRMTPRELRVFAGAQGWGYEPVTGHHSCPRCNGKERT